MNQNKKNHSIYDFSSKRERNLWYLILTLVIAIYSTLGLAQTLAETLRGTGLAFALFVIGYLLVIVTILTQGLKKRPGSLEIGIGIGVAAVYLLVLSRMAIAAERTHVIEYGVVAVFIYEAFMERKNQGFQVPLPAIQAIVLTSVIGLLDELIQAILPSRVFDPRDILFNVLASIMAVGASVVLSWVRRKITSKQQKISEK